MKRFTNVVLIIALICAVAGMVLCGIGAASGGTLDEIGRLVKEGRYSIGWDNDWWDEDPDGRTKQSSYDFSDDELKNLEADIDAGSLNILPSDDAQIHVELKTYHVDADVRNEGGTLKIDVESKNGWWKYRHQVCEVNVYVPEDKVWNEVDLSVDAGELSSQVSVLQAYQLEISVDAGSAVLPHDIVTQHKTSLEVGAGEMQLGHVQAAEMELDTGVGQMSLSADVSGRLSADCGVGEIDLTLQGKKENYNYEIDCGIGEVTLGSENLSSLGTTRRIDNHAGRQVQIDCGVGQVSVTYQGTVEAPGEA